MNKQRILNEIQSTAQANGGHPLGRERFERETGIKYKDWYGRFWARWGDALREAGFEPNSLQAAYKDADILPKLIVLVRELGRYPTYGELRMREHADKEFPSVFARHGAKQDWVSKLAAYCSANPGHEDVAAICTSVMRTKPEVDTDEKQGDDTPDGFVYLIKSGRYYKIGRSNASGRREREIALQLPERANTVHVIRTDDPVGIEAYWHKRFVAQRKNGEWFALSSIEVKAFKRRKFM